MYDAGDCSEENAKNIIAILQFLGTKSYRIEALKKFLNKKQSLIDLLIALFMSGASSMKRRLSRRVWFFAGFAATSWSKRIVVAGLKILHIAIHYDVKCLDVALGAMDVTSHVQSFLLCTTLTFLWLLLMSIE